MKKNILRNEGFQALLCSLFCIVIGIIVGYIVLLMINAKGATEAIVSLLKNWMGYKLPNLQMKSLGGTLVNTAPLILCSLSVLFAYKVGLFNIGASGQYTAGVCASLYAALAWKWNWVMCLLFAVLCGSLLGVICGLLKAYCNVSEVISGIMLNWIMLYITNAVLTGVKEPSTTYTLNLLANGEQAILPTLGMEKLFGGYQYVSIAMPLAIIIAVIVWVLLEKTTLGYELRATGLNKNAAKYAGMKENRNIIMTLAISGALAGLAAACIYLTGITQWSCSSTSVPGMGFNGIAAAFLGGLSPIGSILSSYFIQHITLGGANINLSVYPSQVADLIAGIIIYLCGFVAFFKMFLNRWLDAKEAKNKMTNANDEGGKE